MSEPQFFPLFLNGAWFISKTSLDVFAPFDGRLLAQVSLAGPEDIEAAIQGAVLAKRTMQDWPAYERSEFLRRVAQHLLQNKEKHATVLCLEAAKPLCDALHEIERAAEAFRIAAEEALRISGEIMPMDRTQRGRGFKGYIQPFPVGPVVGIAPFNFPLNLAVHKLAPALAAGCPIILKPASATPLSTLLLAQIFDEIGGLPPGAVSILPCTRAVGESLVTDERIQLLSFTGSDSVGWAMKNKAGKKKVVLELGGNAAVLIAESALWNEHIDALLAASFAYSGQICIHPQRFFVWEGHFNAFANAMANKAKALSIGPPDSLKTQVSSMIDTANAERVDAWIDEAVLAGAQVLLRGQRQGTLLPPCILTQVPVGEKVMEEEVFGPVILLEPYSNFSEALHRINQSRFGLQASIYTENHREMDLAYQNLDVGGLMVNAPPTLRFDHMPYGGVKDSGLGREGIRFAMNDMLEWKLMVKKVQ
jgi:glyceraldehyde-3-phosphate dehydrogenase (NADP+)